MTDILGQINSRSQPTENSIPPNLTVPSIDHTVKPLKNTAIASIESTEANTTPGIALADSMPPKPTNLMALSALSKIPPPEDQNYAVVSLALNLELGQGVSSTPDLLYGLINILSVHKTRQKALIRCEKLIKLTGVDRLSVMSLGSWNPMKLQPTGTTVVTNIDEKEVRKADLDKHQAEIKRYEQQVKHLEEVEKDAENSLQPGTIEHLTNSCITAIRMRNSLTQQQERIRQLQQRYNKKLEQIRTHIQQHPKHEVEWLNELEKTLNKRGQGEAYTSIKEDYIKYRPEILQLSNH